VACGFEIASRSEQPVAVLSFADEEGARFNTPTFGSKALTGKLDLEIVLERRDDRGVRLADAMAGAGVDPSGIGQATAWLSMLAGFVEVHIDQSTDVARAGTPVAIVSSLAARRRLEVTLRGRADHAGTTPRGERRDALAAAARLIVAVDELSLGVAPGAAPVDSSPPDDSSSSPLTVTASRILAEPNAPTTIAALVRLWIDGRASDEAAIDAWQRELEDFARGLAAGSGVQIELATASRSSGTPFAQPVRHALAAASGAVLPRAVGEVVCFAGHDAGVLADKLPAGMVLVRNPSGVSHAPEETVDLADAAVAAEVVRAALPTLAGNGGEGLH
jgi:N-carbamoyl-L-amino-acid hydrolase